MRSSGSPGPGSPAGWSRGALLRLALLAVLLLVAVVVALTISLPTTDQARQWAHDLGPSFPLLFVVVHALVTVTPVPRTVFTLAAGVLFGPFSGVVVAVLATTVSAALALVLVRHLGREAVAERLRHGRLHAVDQRLEQRGWLAVASLRLIPVVPFSVLNYCCGVSSVRMRPFLLATLVGVVPGTVAAVLLGDAMTGRTSPALLGISLACGAIGVLGLLLDRRTPLAAASPDSTSPHR
ncbi:TVP38/TMEM64 family protein [Rhodococcus sp. X156]|uniref:TVP38/TMEM64 family protein n=1 Tax=Rhodococcus sp. X156 TaxID=2499145 RepID=UPI003216361C